MFTKVITISEELKNYVERLALDVESRKELIAFLVEGDRGTHTETFKEYHKDYEEAFTAYSLAKDDVQKKYIPQALLDKDAFNTKWKLEYATAELTITYSGKAISEEEFNSFFN